MELQYWNTCMVSNCFVTECNLEHFRVDVWGGFGTSLFRQSKTLLLFVVLFMLH